MVSGGLKIIFKTGKIFKDDINSKIVPFLRVKAGNRLVDSKKIHLDTIKTELIWNQSLSIAFKNQTQLYIQLLNSDKKMPNFHDEIGACILNMQILQINQRQNIFGAFYNNNKLAALIEFQIIYEAKVQQKIEDAIIEKPLIKPIEIFEPSQSNMQQSITLKFKVIEAKITHDTEAVGDIKPYCKLILKGNKSIQHKTDILKGKSPKWNQLFIFQSVNDSMMVQLTIWDKQSMKQDDFIGGVDINLKQVIRTETVISEFVLKYTQGKNILPAGTVKCQISVL